MAWFDQNGNPRAFGAEASAENVQEEEACQKGWLGMNIFRFKHYTTLSL
jgi:hypothetical protein